MKRALVLLGIVALVALSAALAQATTITKDGISLQLVYDLNNTADTNGFGSVSYAYAIGTYEVTNAQYAAFLNAVGKTTSDADWLLDSRSDIKWVSGVATATNANKPVAYVNFGDEARFANWLNNGQGTTIDTGTYTVSGNLETINNGTSKTVPTLFTRNAVTVGSWAVASNNEWYKAAYYKGGSTNAGYWSYPISSNTAPTTSQAAYSGTLQTVGYYTTVYSPYGCFDMAGEMGERLDSLTYSSNMRRMMAGGSYDDGNTNGMVKTFFATFGGLVDENDYNDVGFRVTEIIPEPGTLALLTTGLIGLFCYAWRKRKRGLVHFGVVALVALSATQVQAATITVDGISLQTVYDLNNTADTVKDPAGNYLGSVSYAYAIGTYEVTNAQYVAFLNAVGNATVVSEHLLAGQDSDITYSGGVYSTTKGTQPMRYVCFANEARYANWLSNGQPTGGTGIDTGTYTVSGNLTASNMTGSPQVPTLFTRGTVSLGSWAVASDNEWYKAAYYKGGSTNAGYWTYPTSSNTAPTGASPPGTNNSANVSGGPGVLEPVGSYTSTASPYGCFDMAGNVGERLDTLVYNSNTRRMHAGSDYDDNVSYSISSCFNTSGGVVDENAYNDLGFRVVEIIPEPGTLALLATGLIGLFCYAWRKRRTGG